MAGSFAPVLPHKGFPDFDEALETYHYVLPEKPYPLPRSPDALREIGFLCYENIQFGLTIA
jgi:hypothetical protein